ncbi:MAG: hypothetical protein Q8Q03_01425 [bacterium]|nr:hypothetical protein [bacterium]
MATPKKTKPAATKGRAVATGTTVPGTLPMPGSTPTSSAKAAGARRAPRPVPTATTVVTSRTTTRTIPAAGTPATPVVAAPATPATGPAPVAVAPATPVVAAPTAAPTAPATPVATPVAAVAGTPAGTGGTTPPTTPPVTPPGTPGGTPPVTPATPVAKTKPAWHSGWWVLAIAGVLLLTLFFWQFDLWPFNDGNTPEVVQMKESVPVIEATITESDVLVTKKIGEETSSVSIKSPSGAIAVITGNISATNSTVYAGTFYGMPPYGTTAPATVKPTAPTPKRTPVWPENFSPDCREKILDCEPKDGVEVNVEMTIPPRKRVSFITPVGWHINPRMTVDSSNYRCALNLGTVTSPRWVDMTQVPSPTSDQDRVEIAEYGFESLSDSPITVIFNLRGR